jgi:hypothetical protein
MQLEDFSAPYSLWRNTMPDEVFEKCHIDGEYYPESEMAYCKQGSLYIHKTNITKYVIECSPFMLSEEINELEKDLLKQI